MDIYRSPKLIKAKALNKIESGTTNTPTSPQTRTSTMLEEVQAIYNRKDFKINKCLGSGAYGIVYHVTNKKSK